MLDYRAWLVGIGALVSLVLLAFAGLVIVEHHGSREQHNPSFRYGQRVMDNVVYGHLGVTQSVERACDRAVLRRVASPPRTLDFGRAVSGCRYEEYVIDSDL